MFSDFNEILITFLLSLSPLGEARAGIPFALLHGISPMVSFTVGLVGNLLVFPMIMFFMDHINKRLFASRFYKRFAVSLTKRARKKTGKLIQKHGFLGLMIFVMIPLPVTGAYIGSIAAYIFGIDRKKSLYAISTGILISCTLVTVGVYLSMEGIKLF